MRPKVGAPALSLCHTTSLAPCLQHWDGLRTKQEDRVLVLAATNRPMDLDDAVIRRMPRRIMVPLPDAANRAKILKASWFGQGWGAGGEHLGQLVRVVVRGA